MLEKIKRKSSIVTKISSFSNKIDDLIYPRRCPVCDRVVKFNYYICEECKKKLVKVGNVKCYKCGKELNDETKEYCYDCTNRQHNYDQGVALYEYNSICNSLYRFKYSGRAEYAEYFGKEMARRYINQIRMWGVDGILSVPLHKTKENIRGYNQAALLAVSMSKYLKIPYYPDYIIRKNKTIPLKELDPNARQINLKNAFIIRGYDVKLERVLIVDDIYTTGSTIDEISMLLREYGVQKVYFVTLAIGTGL